MSKTVKSPGKTITKVLSVYRLRGSLEPFSSATNVPASNRDMLVNYDHSYPHLECHNLNIATIFLGIPSGPGRSPVPTQKWASGAWPS